MLADSHGIPPRLSRAGNAFHEGLPNPDRRNGNFGSIPDFPWDRRKLTLAGRAHAA